MVALFFYIGIFVLCPVLAILDLIVMQQQIVMDVISLVIVLILAFFFFWKPELDKKRGFENPPTTSEPSPLQIKQEAKDLYLRMIDINTLRQDKPTNLDCPRPMTKADRGPNTPLCTEEEYENKMKVWIPFLRYWRFLI